MLALNDSVFPTEDIFFCSFGKCHGIVTDTSAESAQLRVPLLVLIMYANRATQVLCKIRISVCNGYFCAIIENKQIRNAISTYLQKTLTELMFALKCRFFSNSEYSSTCH